MQTASAMINSKKDALKEKLKNEALSPEEREKYEKELSQWNAGGLLLNTIGTGLSAPTNSAGGIAAATASPIVSYQIGQYFKGKDAEGSTAHLVAHAIVGAAVAAAGGNDAVTGGIAAAGTEALAPAVSKWLYGKDTKDLTSDEKNTISSIVGLAGAATGAIVGGSKTDVAQGSQAGLTAVDNNSFIDDEIDEIDGKTVGELIVYEALTPAIMPIEKMIITDRLADESLNGIAELINPLITGLWYDEKLEAQYKDNFNGLKQDIESGKLEFNKTTADLLYRMNQDHNLVINLPPNKIVTVSLPLFSGDADWRVNKTFPNEEILGGTVKDWNDWKIFGNVTVSRDKNSKQKMRVIDDTYDFEMHKAFLNDIQKIRNFETKAGAPGKGTSYKIHLNSPPQIEYGLSNYFFR